MVKPLTFKGDKKVKKRKRTEGGDDDARSKAAKTEEEVENDDSWLSADAVTDISGPVMFVLPTSPPSALSCDVTGKVFTIPIENIVDGNASSAEPHDVRQVWVANKIVGTDHFRFKGHHGKYVDLTRTIVACIC
jgi:protein FRG1